MKSRRDFIKTAGITAAGLSFGFRNLDFTKNYKGENLFKSKRPIASERNFTSEKIEQVISEVKASLKNKELAWLFENCFPNTLDTTVQHEILDGKPDTFVITGDIEAMWLRDSTAQVWPYLQFCNDDNKLKLLIEGVINRQTKCISIDPYANAFNKGAEGSHWESDHTEMKPELHERKWEIDSLCYTIRLGYGFWKETGETRCFDDTWLNSMKLIYKTFVEQQRKEGKGPYSFMRTTARATDTAPGLGYGNPIVPVGLICSIFRPSDDATIFPFLIPSNQFAVVELKHLAEMVDSIAEDKEFSSKLNNLASEVDDAIKKYAVQPHPEFGEIYAFEVDGYGNRLFMDDSNIPSLLSLPYLGYSNYEDKVYANTRNFVLSGANPYFFKGKEWEGIGGPHVGMDYIWPMSITMRALTSNDNNEIKECVKMLIKTHGDTGFMHEGFHKDDPKDFTREWFAWSNTLFGELIYKIYKTNPNILDV